jgi:hypothetical protein
MSFYSVDPIRSLTAVLCVSFASPQSFIFHRCMAISPTFPARDEAERFAVWLALSSGFSINPLLMFKLTANCLRKVAESTGIPFGGRNNMKCNGL